MLSQSRYEQALMHVTSQQRKVFDCIPIAEVWSFKQINAEVVRRGLSIRWDQFQGCVNALKEAGLVKECAPGMFRREQVRQPTEKEPAMPQEIPTIKTKPAAATAAPGDRLGALATRMKTMSDVALQLHHEAVKIHDDLVNLAVELEENGEAAQRALQQLATLKALFKD